MLHPQCLWWQDHAKIYLTLDHPDLEVDLADVDGDGVLHLNGHACGAGYAAQLPLGGTVAPEVVVQKSTRNCPCIVLTKTFTPEQLQEQGVRVVHEVEEEAEEAEEGEELSDLSCSDEEKDAAWWSFLLAASAPRNRFIRQDWSRWKDTPEEPSFDMNSLQQLLHQQSKTC
jgi:hypothetical protein